MVEKNSMEAEKVFKKTLKGKNVMTTDVIDYVNVDDCYYFELSAGEGIRREDIYGVTVLRKEKGKIIHDYNLCKLFYSLNDAYNYIYSFEKDDEED